MKMMIQASLFLKKLNSAFKSRFFVASKAGNQSFKLNKVTRPTNTTTAKDMRHEKLCPIKVPKGTPTILAMVKPINISETACAAFPFSAILLATTDPTPKNAP
ncbi:hypothetical protein D3C73_1157570 [compost metagenome]